MPYKSIERLSGRLSQPLVKDTGNRYRLSILFSGEILFMCHFQSAFKIIEIRLHFFFVNDARIMKVCIVCCYGCILTDVSSVRCAKKGDLNGCAG